jgi:trk/ktr system potassium uptake protein
VRVIVVGGGKVGAFLARELRDDGHVVTVIEANPRLADQLSDEAGMLVFQGDGTDVRLLDAADVDRADWLLAVTGRDEDNLVACQLAATLGARKVLARLNDPRNRATFEALDLPVVAVTDLMASMISREIELTTLRRVALLGEGQVSLVERVVPDGFPDKPLSDLRFPPPSVIVSVVRDGSVTVPSAATRFVPGDRVLAVTSLENEQAFCDALDAMSEEGS